MNLSRGTTRVPSQIAITTGLTLGLGMTCVTVWTSYFILGIIIGTIGLIIIGTTYLIYTKMVENKRGKLVPQILKLTEEIEKI